MPAAAELGVNLTAATDDRFRGHSISEGQPVSTLELADDMPSGGYFGASATGVATAHNGVKLLGEQEYAGYARRFADGLTLDVGAANANYTHFYSGGYPVGYSEVYGGVITNHFAAHIHYSPNYFRRGAETLYADTDVAWRVGARWRLSGHAGLLTAITPVRPSFLHRAQYDWRLGIGRKMGRLDVQLGVTGAGAPRDYYAGATHPRTGIVASVGRAF